MYIGLAPFSLRHSVFNKTQVESTYKKLSEIGFNGIEDCTLVSVLGFRYENVYTVRNLAF